MRLLKLLYDTLSGGSETRFIEQLYNTLSGGSETRLVGFVSGCLTSLSDFLIYIIFM